MEAKEEAEETESEMTIKELKQKFDGLDENLPVCVEMPKPNAACLGAYVFLQDFRRMNVNGNEVGAVRISVDPTSVPNT